MDVVMACRVANKAAQSECIWQKGGIGGMGRIKGDAQMSNQYRVDRVDVAQETERN